MTTFEQLRAAIASKPIRIPDSVPVPEVGQVWRAIWGSTVSNVYIDDVSDDTVAVLPVTGDPSLVPSVRTYLGAAESPLGYPSAIWGVPRVDVPVFVLAGCYGEVPDSSEEVIRPRVPLSARAQSADPGWRLEQHVRQVLASQADARWLPRARPVGPIRLLMRSAGISARALAEGTGLPTDLLAMILDGSWWISPQATEVLTTTLGVSAPDLPSEDPLIGAGELVRAINSPTRKRAFMRRGRHDGVPEAKARFVAAQQLLPARARRAASTTDERSRWDQLLDTYLENA